MACREADRLRDQVLHCTSVYLEADSQRDPMNANGPTALVADFAIYALNEAKRKYWFHVNQHKCDAMERS